MKQSYMLPNGMVTYSNRKYTSAWRSAADRIAKVFGGTRHSYDPGVAINVSGRLVEIDKDATTALLKILDENDSLRRENEGLKRRLERVSGKGR